MPFYSMKFHLPSHRKDTFSDRVSPVVSSDLPGHRAARRMALLAGAVCLLGGACQLAAAPTPTPAPTSTAVPSVAPSATPEGTSEVRNYTGTEQSDYIKTANNAFLEARGVKSTAFVEANNAYLQAGGASAKGLTSKEAVVARRDMLQKAIQANDDYLAFVETQQTVYHDELAKTPLIKADVDGLTSDFVEHARTDEVKKLRATERDLLQTGDAMMEYLEKKYGAWKLNDNKPVFKKSSDASAYSSLGKKYNAYVEAVQKLSASVNSPLPTPGASPAPSTSPSPSGAAQPQTTVGSAEVSPTPKAKP